MRYYRIEIDSGVTTTRSGTGQSSVTSFKNSVLYTSFNNGQNIRGALQVELDIPVAPFHSPDQAGAYVKIWGIPLSVIKQSNDLARRNIRVFGGFQKGLPLANPQQSGLLVQGTVYQAFGNWLGTDMSLDLVITPGPSQPNDKPLTYPRNITLNWKKGSTLSEAIKSALTAPFSNFTINVNVSDKLTALEDVVGFYPTLTSFAQFINNTSIAMVGGNTYPGVSITIKGNTINVFDNTTGSPSSSTSSKVKEINFKDLIGQPTWIQAPSIRFKTAMRADIEVGDEISMPPSQITNSQQAQSSLINQVAAQRGTFKISSVHHFGNFRQPDAYSWVTEFNAYPTKPSSSGVATS